MYKESIKRQEVVPSGSFKLRQFVIQAEFEKPVFYAGRYKRNGDLILCLKEENAFHYKSEFEAEETAKVIRYESGLRFEHKKAIC